MSAVNPITEAELDEAFQDDPEFGLALLHEDFRLQIARYIKSVAWSLQPEDIKDVYQETMLSMVSVIQSPDFDGQQVMKIVYDVACKRAVDALRRKKHRPKADTDGAIQHIAKDLGATNLGTTWRGLERAVWSEFRVALHESINKLSPKQIIVARVFVDHYEEFKERDTYAPLARGVSEVTGQPESVVTIKKLWQEAKKRLVKDLVRRGFRFLETEE